MTNREYARRIANEIAVDGIEMFDKIRLIHDVNGFKSSAHFIQFKAYGLVQAMVWVSQGETIYLRIDKEDVLISRGAARDAKDIHDRILAASRLTAEQVSAHAKANHQRYMRKLDDEIAAGERLLSIFR